MEVAFFSAATLLIGRLGVETVAAHQVGFNVGADDYAGASRSAWVATSAAVVWGVGFATALLMIWRHDLVGLYTMETDVVQLAAGLLLLGALFQVFDGPQATVMGTLRGYKDTRAPMVIALVAYWLFGLPVGATLCFGLQSIPGIGVYGMWWGSWSGLPSSRARCSPGLRESQAIRCGSPSSGCADRGARVGRGARISSDPVRIAQLRLR